MKWFKNEKYIISNTIKEVNREELINLYYKYFILLNGYDKMDAFLKVTNDKISHYLDKDIYKDATNYKKAVKLVNSLNNKNNYLFIYNNNMLVGLARLEENKNNLRILELITDTKIYKKVLQYLEKYSKNNNYKKIYLEIPINDIKLLIDSVKLGYIEEDITSKNKYIVNKDI